MHKGFDATKTLSDRETRIVFAFMWLEQWNRTMVDLGFSREEVDPWYWQGVVCLRAGMSEAEQQEIEEMSQPRSQ